jgi:LCP family protein required for cell wall assembly
MANRRNDPYGQDDYYDDGYYDDGYYDQDGYYDEDGYYDQDGYYDEGYSDGGYSDGGGYYDDGYYDQDDYYTAPSKPSMAARASGKANPDPYRRSRQSQPRRTQRQSQGQYYETSPQPRRRKKKRHPFRKLLVVLLILIAILAGLYFLLFQAPEQTNDGLHTRKDGFYNILICATDEEELRTDTIMIASLDQENGTVSLTSLPRDTIVDNGQAVPKLNGVYGLAGGGEAGAEALMDQVETLLGFRPDGYAVINYQIFKDVVDAMGGVTFDVPMDMTVDNANDPDDVLEIAAGEQVLDGTMALGVCRYRYGYLMADIQRQYVQQSFLKAMIQQLMSPKKLLKLPAVYSSAMDNIVTDLSGANIRYLCLHVLLSGMNDIQQNTLPGEAVTYNGASCYGLYGQSVVDLVNQVMNPYEEPITLDDVHMLTVSGGTLVESTWSGTAFDASTYQYD